MPDAVVLTIVAVLVVLIIALYWVAAVLRSRFTAWIWKGVFRSVDRAVGASFPGIEPTYEPGKAADGGIEDIFDAMSGRAPAKPAKRTGREPK